MREFDKLSDSEIEFLRMVSAAAVANPFGTERDSIDQDLFRRLSDRTHQLTTKSIGTATQEILSKSGFGGEKRSSNILSDVGHICTDV